MSESFVQRPLIEIDGSILEGGGQILRIALSLSAIKKIPVKITKIRAGRSRSGLMEQHLKGVELVRDLCNARVIGATFGSTEIEFWPNDISGGAYGSFIKTAGSISLLIQVALPVTLYAKAPTMLRLHGGTNTEMAPQIDYLTEVFKPVLEKFGATFDFHVVKRGYFPRGGGEVTIRVRPPKKPLNPIELVDFGNLKSIYGWSFVAGSLPIKVANIMAYAVIQRLGANLVDDINIERYKENKQTVTDNGSGIILVAETDTGCYVGGSALGQKGEEPEQTGRRAVNDLLKAIYIKACVDEHCQDQIIIYMALANGRSSVKVGEITLHTKTAIFIAEKMTKAKFEIIPDGKTNIITCTGENQ